MYENIANWLTMAFFLGSLIQKWRMFHLTHSRGLLLIIAGFAWTIVVRMAIVLHTPFLYEHSRSMTLLTAILFFAGITMLLRSLEHVLEPVLESAAMAAKAAAAAQLAREHALDAAGKAEAARLYAARAAELADKATKASRQATRASGVASEASREADEKVGKNEH